MPRDAKKRHKANAYGDFLRKRGAKIAAGMAVSSCEYRFLYRSQGATSTITVEWQGEHCRDFAKQQDWQIKKEYIAAEGVSGTLDDPLTDIKEAIETDEVDVVLVYSYFCISGDHMKLPLIIKWLLNNDIEFWSVMEGNFLIR